MLRTRCIVLTCLLALAASPLARAGERAPVHDVSALATAIVDVAHAAHDGELHGDDAHAHETHCATPSCSGSGSTLPPGLQTPFGHHAASPALHGARLLVDDLRHRPPLRPPRLSA